MTIEAVTAITIRFGDQLHRLKPGETVDLPSDKACLLLEGAPNKVRLVEGESAIHPGGVVTASAAPNASPVFWESVDRTWHGPVKPEFLGRTGSGHNERFWVIVRDNGTFRWIWADLLRSQQTFSSLRRMAK